MLFFLQKNKSSFLVLAVKQLCCGFAKCYHWGSLMKVVWGIYYFSNFSENLKIIAKFESIFLKALIWAGVRNEWEIEDTGLDMNW